MNFGERKRKSLFGFDSQSVDRLVKVFFVSGLAIILIVVILNIFEII